ncbi:PP2C family protein-serine/threonine phosphatase [Pedobacter psychrodurus]|uniref:PP2C family protein-serine/threonine phosphatase n=1 Tax=Pedobacter psychrodurus TaxID=2530456 RepID=UPI0029310517|nr:protein phosphatase 2C domain-containing protein [Pedobacter psychrodurus]
MNIKKLSEKGKRTDNQDFLLIDTSDALRNSFIIADGMSGYVDGAVAAKLSCEKILDKIKSAPKINTVFLQESIDIANQAILEINTNRQELSGAAVAGLVLHALSAHIFWLGDLTVYALKNGKVIFQTRSHTMVNALQDSGIEFDEQTILDYTHILTRNLSGKPEKATIGYHYMEVEQGDQFLICSDGALPTIDQWIAGIPSSGAIDLPEKDLATNSEDNYSAILITV